MIGEKTEAPVDDRAASFRADLRAWLATNHPGPEPAEEDEAFAFRRRWQRRLNEGGWMGITWPSQYGGRGLTALEGATFNEELVRARAPRPAGLIGLEMGGPTIISHGTEAQKERFLRPLLSGDEIWCQAFSEPGAGSDLAAVGTVARRDGDEWVVTGQKVWTSFAHEARWSMVLVRTDRSQSAHRGLTYLLLDMNQPGVSVRRIEQMTGEAEFNEIFFDEARVPVSDQLGAEGEGWSVAITTLMHERANLASTLATDVQLAVQDLAKLVEEQAGEDAVADAKIRDRLERLRIGAEILRLTTLRTLSRLADGRPPGPEASLSKLRWAEVNQGVTELALEIIGRTGTLNNEEWNYRFLRSRANSIEGGTTEILKSIVAKRVLGIAEAG